MKLITDLSSDNIKGLVLSLAIPSMLSQLVSVAYSIVDRMYIGNIPVYGEMALAGIGICGPVANLITAFAFLIGIGGSPLVSIRMGSGRMEEARKVIANSFLMLIVLSISLMIGIYAFRESILMTFGASERTYVYADAYFKIYLAGTVFQLLSVGMNQFIITQGFGKDGMISVMLGAIINIVLDPIFIFVFDMGVRGAALATVISQFASCVYVLRFLFSDKAKIKITFGNYEKSIMKDIIKLGLSAWLIILTDNVLLVAINAVLQKYGGEGYGDVLITCNTILQSFILMVVMPLGGLTMGTTSILGYNLGAGRGDKIIKAQKIIFTIALIFCTIMFIASRTIGKYFIYIFTREPEYVALTERFLRMYTLGVIPLAIQYEVVDGFTGMGEVRYALPVSLFRKILFLITVITIPKFFDIEYVFYSESISDIIPPAVSFIVYLLVIKKVINKPRPGALGGTPLNEKEKLV